MTKYDCYRVMTSDGRELCSFHTKKEAVQVLKEIYRVTRTRMYILDVKGNVVFE